MKGKGFNSQFTITNKITTELTRIQRAQRFLEAATLPEDWMREMGRRASVLEALYTTHIEGICLTLDKPKFKKTVGRYNAYL